MSDVLFEIYSYDLRIEVILLLYFYIYFSSHFFTAYVLPNLNRSGLLGLKDLRVILIGAIFVGKIYFSVCFFVYTSYEFFLEVYWEILSSEFLADFRLY
jgi:hypothetical protein